MAKAFLLLCFVAFFSAVVVLFAFQFNMLPAPMYAYIYELELKIPFLSASIPPYLQKYEGTWSISFVPVRTQTDLGNCAIASGSIHVHAGVFSGTVGAAGGVLPFNASTTDDGRVTGTLGGSTTVRKGVISANIDSRGGTGQWSDGYECGGSAVFVKQTPVIDPVEGRVVSVSGTTNLVRGGVSRRLIPGLSLYKGDVVEAQDGAVTLGMGLDFGTVVTLTPNMTYKVGQ